MKPRGLPQSHDGVQISQVIVNLVRNAVEAMQDPGRHELFVSTAATVSRREGGDIC